MLAGSIRADTQSKQIRLTPSDFDKLVMKTKINVGICAFIFSIFYFLNVRSEGVRSNPQVTQVEYFLDLENQAQWPWSLSDPKYEDWFFYYENLTTTGLSDFSKEYFKDVNLIDLESADGVWVAYHSNSSPIFGDDFPVIGFSGNADRVETLQLVYYIHGTANIVFHSVEDGTNHTLNQTESAAVPEWKTCSWNLTSASFNLWLMPNQEGDFVLIDKINILGPETIATTTVVSPTTNNLSTKTNEMSTTTSQPPSDEYILDSKNQAHLPWSLSTLDPRYEDWFFYYDNMSDAGLTPFAENYFKNVTLTSLESAEGVWVSFYSNFSPIFGEDFPFIQFYMDSPSPVTLELNYYIHGSANITLEGDVEVVLRPDPTSVPKWETYCSDLTTSSFKLWLMPCEEGDFVLIDKIALKKLEEITTITTIQSTTNTADFSITTEIITITQSPPTLDYVLDVKNQLNWPWAMSLDRFEDWFFYYDNLTDAGLTSFSKEYFKEISLTNMKSADGVWTAYYVNSSTIFGDPFIEFSSNNVRVETLEFRYYIQGSGKIILQEGTNHTLNQTNSSPVPTWESYSLDLSFSFFRLWLKPTQQGDFIMIDKITIKVSEIIDTTTVSTTTVSETDQEYILDYSNQISAPWALLVQGYPNWFDYFDDLQNESISEVAKEYFKLHDIDLEHLQLQPVEGVWIALHTEMLPIPDQKFPIIQMSGTSVETVEFNFYLHGNATIRLCFWNPDECFELKKMETDSIPSWQSNTTIRVPSIDFFQLELRANTEGDFILIDKVVGSQCHLNEYCRSMTEQPPTSTGTSGTSFTTTQRPLTTGNLETNSTDTNPSTSSIAPENSSTSSTTEDGNQGSNANSLKTSMLLIILSIFAKINIFPF